jgi:hypothetical protein
MKTKKIQNPVQYQTQTAPVSAPVNPTSPNADEVAVRAYYIYLNNGAQDGHDEENWLQAEAALKNEARSA